MSNDIRALTQHVTQGLEKINQSLADIKGDITAHGNRISTVETTLSSVIVRLDDMEKVSCNDSSEYLLSEFERRLKAKFNVLIFDLPEPVIDNFYNYNKDSELVSTIFNAIQPSNSPFDQLKFFRIGKFSTSRPKPRPLKLQFASANLATEFLRAARSASETLKEHQTLRSMIFAPDRTKNQQDQYRSLKSALKRRQDQGELNLIIRYINGTPTIVPVHPDVVNSRGPNSN